MDVATLTAYLIAKTTPSSPFTYFRAVVNGTPEWGCTEMLV
jgi:hypothetical protein